MTSFVKKATQLTLAVLVLLAVCVPMFSQAAVGTILGGIFDTSGASISGAKVTITDVARGTTRVLTTNSTGEYTAPSLLAGTYSVRAEFQGFQATEHSNIVLGIAQDVRVDLTLSPGAQTQTVTVTEEVPAIDTTSATLGGTITNTSIVELPIIDRNFLNLMELRPGVTNVSPGGDATATVTNGRRQGADVLVVEGVTQFDLATSNVLIDGAQKGGGGTQFPLDAVQEFSSTQNSPAEYGWRDGSAINLGVKSGTNAIHGSAYAFGRRAQWTDARSYLPQGGGTLGNLTVENPGAALGGPILKNKLFWFAAVEFVRQDSYSTSGTKTPTDVPGLGTSISMVDACNAIGRANVNSLSAQIAGLPAGSCTPQPGTATFENLFPYNIQTGPNAQTVFAYPTSSTPSNNGLAKIDYSPNDKNHFSGFFYMSKQTSLTNGALQPGSIAAPYWGSTGIGSTEQYAGAWTYTPNSSWVNDLRGGAAPNSGNSVNGDINLVSGLAFGSGGYGINSGVTSAATGGLMCINITSAFSSNTTGLGDCGKNGIRGPQYQLDFSDKVSYLHGNHAFKFGYEEVFVHFDDSSTANLNGTVNFATITGNPNTPLENFLTGTTNTASIISGDNTDHYRERWHAAFVQDTWRITKRVTITPGLRWEYIGSPHSTDNHLGTFDPTLVGGMAQVGPGLPVSTITHPQKTNFNPRVGAAWDIRGNGKTVLRAGIGNLSSFPAILTITGAQTPYQSTMCNGTSGTNPVNGAATCPAPATIVVNQYGNPIQAFGAVTQSFVAGATGVDKNWTANNASPIFPVSSSLSATSGPTCSTNVPCSMLVSTSDFKNPRSVQWQIDIQRALTNNLTLDVAYVGTHGYNEVRSVDLNEPALGTGWNTPWSAASITTFNNAQKSAATKLAVGDAGFTSAQICIGQAVAADIGKCTVNGDAITAARPYAAQFPYFKYIVQTTNGFRSNYNGLQVTLDGRNYHGLHFLAAYTYSHALDDWTKSSQATSAAADPANPQYQYGSSDQDLRHRFRFSPTYAIPGIKSPGQMLQGWTISAIWAFQTGFAWAPNDQKTNDFGGTGEIADATIPTPNGGNWQTWNYSGPKAAFSNLGFTPVPCWNAGGTLGCTAFASAPAALSACQTAAQAPYTNAAQQALALQALNSAAGGCYMQNGGIITPPAFGTLGNAGRGVFNGPHYQDIDFTVAKNWHMKERYGAQFRIECYNCFNMVNPAQFSDGASDPSIGSGGVVGSSGFGYHTGIQGSMRRFQFGLKLTF